MKYSAIRGFTRPARSPRPFGLLALALVAGVAACEGPSTPIAPPESFEAAQSRGAGDLTKDVRAQLAALRRVTAPYHDFEKAVEDGYTIQITDCMVHESLGTMGIHYGNGAYLVDPAVRATEPEVLIYNPRRDGSLRLVGIEFVVPFDVIPETAPPPTVMGRELQHNFTFGVWALHVWPWLDNPSGTFADWNPKASCEHEGG